MSEILRMKSSLKNVTQNFEKNYQYGLLIRLQILATEVIIKSK